MITIDEDVLWNGDFIVFWASQGAERIRCAAPRKAINRLPGFGAATSQMIGMRRSQVRDLLAPHAIEKIARNDFAPTTAMKTVYLSHADFQQ
jgi:hypothetical protein